MKNILPWIKSHWLIVLFSALILVIPPAAWFGSDMWRTSIKTEVEKQAKDALDKVEKSKVVYSLAPALPGAQAVEFKSAPNTRTTAWFKEQSDLLANLSKGVVKTAEDFNRGVGPHAESAGRTEHKPLVEGLFPVPSEEPAELKKIAFAERLVGKQGVPSVYAAMLRRIRAGDRREPAQLAQTLRAYYDREVEKLKGGKADAKLTPDEESQVQEKVLGARRASYVDRTREISVYATLDALPFDGAPNSGNFGGDSSGGHGSTIPKEIPAQPPALWQTFLWQMDYWLISDLLDAVHVANTEGGRPTSLDRSVVKRIERITLGPPIVAAPGSGDAPADASATAAPAPAGPADGPVAAMVPLDPAYSVTGRKSGPANPLYDVRVTELRVVCSSARLPKLFDALASTNLMTVIGVELSAVDVWADLDQGYYYGDESVIRAVIKIESVWLRNWTTPLMPAGVRTRLGLPLPEGMKPEPGDAPADPNAAGSPAAPPPPPADEPGSRGRARGPKGSGGR